MKILLLSTVISLITAGNACATSTISPKAINAKIQRVGAQKTLDSLSTAQRDDIFTGVASGSQAWLSTAAKLRGVTDGSTSEGLDGAMSKALQTNPSAVLRLIKQTGKPDINWICEDRAIEPSATEDRAFLDRAKGALGKVSDPGLITLRDQCVQSLDRTSGMH